MLKEVKNTKCILKYGVPCTQALFVFFSFLQFSSDKLYILVYTSWLQIDKLYMLVCTSWLKTDNLYT